MHIFNNINNNPFTEVFNSPNYELTKVIKHITTIYESQTVNNDTMQSSDFHLQFLRKDINNMWTNKYIILQGKQEVMLVDIIPYPILINKCEIEDSINNLDTFDVVYSEL